MSGFSIKYTAVTLLLIILAGVGGFFLSRNLVKLPSIGQNTAVSTPAPVTKDPIFKSQTAVIQGLVTKSEAGNLTVTSTDNHTETFPISSKFIIYKPALGSKPATGSSTINTVDLGQVAYINLEVIDGVYKVTSITYPPTPPVPPAK